MGIYTGKKNKIGGNNGNTKEYRTLNETFRIYQFLKDNPDKQFCISDITRTVAFNSSTVNIKPKLLFLLKLGVIGKIKTVSRATNLYYYKNDNIKD